MIDELQAVFRQRAADLVDDGLPARTSAVYRRVQGTKRRRALVAVAAAAVVVPVAATAVMGVKPFDRSDPSPGPITPPEVTVPVREAFAGRTLIDSMEVEGKGALVLTVDALKGSQWMLWCAGVGPEYTVHQTLDGEFEREAPCQVNHVSDGTMSFRFEADSPAGRGRELRLWLTRTSDGSLVAPAKAVLAAAVYELPHSVAAVAGSDVMPIEEDGGVNWAVASYGDSARGARSYTATFPARKRETMLELVTDGSGTATVGLIVDGVELATQPLGSVNVGRTLAPGSSHTVTLRINGHVPADARLGIVRRTQVH